MLPSQTNTPAAVPWAGAQLASMLGTAEKPGPSNRQAWLFPVTPARLMVRSVPAGFVTRRCSPSVSLAARARHRGWRARKSVKSPPSRIIRSVNAVMDRTRAPAPMASRTARVCAMARVTGRKTTSAAESTAATAGPGSSLSMDRSGGITMLRAAPASSASSATARATAIRSASVTMTTFSAVRTLAHVRTRILAPSFIPAPPCPAARCGRRRRSSAPT